MKLHLAQLPHVGVMLHLDGGRLPQEAMQFHRLKWRSVEVTDAGLDHGTMAPVGTLPSECTADMQLVIAGACSCCLPASAILGFKLLQAD